MSIMSVYMLERNGMRETVARTRGRDVVVLCDGRWAEGGHQNAVSEDG
jgi:hypothetical protein